MKNIIFFGPPGAGKGTQAKTISKYFDLNQVKLALPNKNDFGEMNREEILGWKKQYGVS